jgi:hypothetical protein
MASDPGSDVGSAAIHIDGCQDFDANGLHHVVHRDLPMKVGELRPRIVL